MVSPLAQAFGYIVLVISAVAMATGAAGLFAQRLRAVVAYTAVLQGGYVALGVSAGLLTGLRDSCVAAVFQLVVAGISVGLMQVVVAAVTRETGDALPLAEDAAPPAWCVFCLALACMSLVGLPPLAGLPAKVAILHAGLRQPPALLLVTIGAAAVGVVSLWAYAGIVLPMISGRVSTQPPTVSPRLRVAVDFMIAVIIALGLAPYLGFAIGAALAGGR